MEWLSSFSGLSGIPILVTVLVVLVGLIIAVKKGLISFNGKSLKVGIQDNERTVIRQQMQLMRAIMNGTIKDIPPRLKEGLHYYRAKYVIEEVSNLLEESIIYNHITDDETYIKLKQEVCYNKVIELTDDDFFRKPQFKSYIFDLIEDLIKQFVKIREKVNG